MGTEGYGSGRSGRRGARAARWGTAVVTVAAVLGGVAVTQAGAAQPGGARGGDHAARGALDTDVRAVREAGGGKVKVLAQTTNGRDSARARAGTDPKVPWDARFRAASVTKTFTSTVALQLVDEGKLSLEDTVEKWLPGTVRGNGNDGSRITVRDLLQQTSGVFDYVEDPEVAGALGDFEKARYDATPAEEWVALAMRHKPLFTPDHAKPRWAYSNTNYLLAGMIIEKAGGLPWREQVEHRVIAPIGLRSTSVAGVNPFMPGPHPRITVPAPDGGKMLDVTEHSIAHGADSAVISTTDDLNTFYRALMTGKLLPKAQLAEMRRTVERTDDPDDVAAWPEGGYGLGIRWQPLSCGGGYWHHEGDGFGTYTRTAASPDGRRSVAVSVTSDGVWPDQAKLNKATRTLADHALCAKRR